MKKTQLDSTRLEKYRVLLELKMIRGSLQGYVSFVIAMSDIKKKNKKKNDFQKQRIKFITRFELIISDIY
jgi:hypothetical protein